MEWYESAKTALFGVASNMEDRGSKRKAFREQVFGGQGALDEMLQHLDAIF